MRTVAGLLVAMALLAGCGGSGEPRGLIVFNSDRDGDWEIFVMNADGSDVYSTGQGGWVPSWGD